MVPSYFKIETLEIQDEFVLSGRKGLSQKFLCQANSAPMGE